MRRRKGGPWASSVTDPSVPGGRLLGNPAPELTAPGSSRASVAAAHPSAPCGLKAPSEQFEGVPSSQSRLVLWGGPPEPL